MKRWAEHRNRHFSKEDIQMAKRLMKRCSIWLIISEMQIKTAMRHHLTPVRMASIKKCAKNKYWRLCREKGILLHRWWECKLVQPKMIQINLFTKQKQTHRLRKWTYGYQKGRVGGIDWEVGIDTYTLLYFKKITNKDLLYSTGNSAQYSIIT